MSYSSRAAQTLHEWIRVALYLGDLHLGETEQKGRGRAPREREERWFIQHVTWTVTHNSAWLG